MEAQYPPDWTADPQSESPVMIPDAVPIRETWEAMEELQRSGLCKQIGVSNFNVGLIRDLLSYATIRPSVLQIESHPYLTQEKLLRYCREESIAVTAFSPLGAGSYVSLGMAEASDSVLMRNEVLEIALLPKAEG